MNDGLRRHIGLFMYGLTSGGVARRMVTLANGLAERGDRVDLLLVRADNVAGIEVDDRVEVIGLTNWLSYLPWKRRRRRHEFKHALSLLAAYMRRSRPDALIVADVLANVTALKARRRADLPLPLIVTQRTHTSTFIASKRSATNRSKLTADIKRFYPEAEAIVGVSEGVSADLIEMGLSADMVRTIYNPVIGPETAELAAERIDHPWFQPGQPPIILGAGRLTPQKDYPTLLKAFAKLIDAGRDLRLVIIGSEKSAAEKEALFSLADELGIRDRLDLPGGVANPFAYMAKSALLACSSKWEGLPAMLIEALAVGTPVVSTDCPSGPREVLADESLGRLVPVGDDQALARAMAATLDDPPESERLIRSADRFTIQASVDAYSSLIDDLRVKLAA